MLPTLVKRADISHRGQVASLEEAAQEMCLWTSADNMWCGLALSRRGTLKHSHYQTLEVVRLRHSEDDRVILSLSATLDYGNRFTGIIGGFR